VSLTTNYSRQGSANGSSIISVSFSHGENHEEFRSHDESSSCEYSSSKIDPSTWQVSHTVTRFKALSFWCPLDIVMDELVPLNSACSHTDPICLTLVNVERR
jgi:hypothetical protein